MPLLDLFHPPLSLRRNWSSVHGYWASFLGGSLNSGLWPPGYFAEMHVSLAGGRVEVDVAAQKESSNGIPSGSAAASSGGVATLTAEAWAPPAPALEMPAVFPDEMEVLVFESKGGLSLVAAIELVSPGNKDRPEARRAFAMKCLTYLQQGIGLIVVDVVTERHANLHDEMAN